MNKPVDLKSFNASPLRDNFIAELGWLCFQIEKDAEEIFSKYEVGSTYKVITNVEDFGYIYSILSNAAKIHELAHTTKKEAHHIERAKFFLDLLAPLNLIEIYDKKVRNTIEHYSEYLDKANRRHQLYSKKYEYVVACNLILTDWRKLDDQVYPFDAYMTPLFEVPIYPVKVYIVNEMKFYNMDFSIDIKRIVEEVKLIKKHLKVVLPDLARLGENWLSMMLFFKGEK